MALVRQSLPRLVRLWLMRVSIKLIYRLDINFKHTTYIYIYIHTKFPLYKKWVCSPIIAFDKKITQKKNSCKHIYLYIINLVKTQRKTFSLVLRRLVVSCSYCFITEKDIIKQFWLKKNYYLPNDSLLTKHLIKKFKLLDEILRYDLYDFLNISLQVKTF